MVGSSASHGYLVIGDVFVPGTTSSSYVYDTIVTLPSRALPTPARSPRHQHRAGLFTYKRADAHGLPREISRVSSRGLPWDIPRVPEVTHGIPREPAGCPVGCHGDPWVVPRNGPVELSVSGPMGAPAGTPAGSGCIRVGVS